MDHLDFSEEEIEEQLMILGYKNIPRLRLREFKRDLDALLQGGEWERLASNARLHTDESQAPPPQSNPPAYTKEKVSQCYFDDGNEGFFLHAGQVDHDRQVFTSGQTRDFGQQQTNRDSYAQHSVSLKLRLPPGAPTRLQAEPDPDDSLCPPLTDSYTSSPDTQGRRIIKRKVLRKHQGRSFVCDESVYSEDSVSRLEDRLADLHVSTAARRDFESESDDAASRSGAQSSDADGVSMSAFESYIRGMTRAQSDVERPKPKAFIRPVVNPTVKKTDPVAKYFQYKQLWDIFKPPGETDRRALRQEIRERLVYQPPPPKPRRVIVPNTYIVPTEKKRSALRWEIRNDLANRLIPYKFSY